MNRTGSVLPLDTLESSILLGSPSFYIAPNRVKTITLLVGEVGADPTTPEETDLQSAAVADLLLSHIYLLVYGVLFILDDRASACAYYPDADFQTHISVLVPRAGIEPATP